MALLHLPKLLLHPACFLLALFCLGVSQVSMASDDAENAKAALLGLLQGYLPSLAPAHLAHSRAVNAVPLTSTGSGTLKNTVLNLDSLAFLTLNLESCPSLSQREH